MSFRALTGAEEGSGCLNITCYSLASKYVFRTANIGIQVGRFDHLLCGIFLK